MTGQEELRREGQAQQDKAETQPEVARKEAEAEKACTQARVHEAAQRSRQ